MKLFTKIDGYTGHGFYTTNFNLKNEGRMIQLFINGSIVNRCILGVKQNKLHFRYKGQKFCLLACDETK